MSVQKPRNHKLNILILSIFCVVSVRAQAQDISKFRLGFSALYSPVKSDSSVGELTTTFSGSIFLEKEFSLSSNKQLQISPGVSYNVLGEEFRSTGMGGGTNRDLVHYSLSGYAKLIHQLKNNKSKTVNYYYGLLGGTHILTWNRGEINSYAVHGPDRVTYFNFDGKNFPTTFRKLYYGVLIGVHFNTATIIKPSFEFRFLPNYAKYEYTLTPFEIAISFKLCKNNH